MSPFHTRSVGARLTGVVFIAKIWMVTLCRLHFTLGAGCVFTKRLFVTKHVNPDDTPWFNKTAKKCLDLKRFPLMGRCSSHSWVKFYPWLFQFSPTFLFCYCGPFRVHRYLMHHIPKITFYPFNAETTYKTSIIFFSFQFINRKNIVHQFIEITSRLTVYLCTHVPDIFF